MTTDALARAAAFCAEYGLQAPVLMAPMAGACPPPLAAAVGNAGGMGACGALLMSPEEIRDWAAACRAASNGAFQMNLWIPDAPPVRDPTHEARLRAFLSGFGPEPDAAAPDRPGPDFDAQCERYKRIFCKNSAIDPHANFFNTYSKSIATFVVIT